MSASTSAHPWVLKHHFDNLHQQHASERLGMWMFLATEILFFAGLFGAYTVYRMWYPADFEFASSHLLWKIAAVNTFLLVTSSLTMTLAIRCAQTGDRKGLIRNLFITAALGSGFMGCKAYEYYTDFEEHLLPTPAFYESEVYKGEGSHDLPHVNAERVKHHLEPISAERVRLFLCFYYAMTGIHSIHLAIGIFVVLWLAVEGMRGSLPPENYSTVEVVSLYWHLVDAIWLFLMPLLYLAGAGMHGH